MFDRSDAKSGYKYLDNIYYTDLSNVIQPQDMERAMIPNYKKYEILRNKRKETNYQVANGSGVSRSTLSEWKDGKHAPELPTLSKLANYFNVSLEEFLG